MRKDFLVDPYQVLEARAAGAGGVLVIVRMLTRARMEALLDAAAELGLFVLLEAFDDADLEAARAVLTDRRPAGRTPSGPPAPAILVGINCRDLQTLAVVPQRFAELAPRLPPSLPCVAESGVATPAEALAMRGLGYRLALIGTALMGTDDPATLLADILQAARTPKA
jgi:indole-3-glycerol phosphate synthase